MIKIIPCNDIINLIKEYTELDKLEIGDSILNILEKRTGVLDRKIETKNNTREVIITIDEYYLKKLNVSMINVTQLPMLVAKSR